MKIIEKQTKYEVREGGTEIDIPYEKGVITFAYLSFCLDTYLNVGKQILENNLLIPTAEQTASLIHAVYLGPKEFTKKSQIEDIKKIMRNRWLWVFNQNLWTDKGVYVVQDNEAKGSTEELNEEKLESILKDGTELSNGVKFSKDKKVRFAPKDSYKLREHTPDSLAEYGFVVASFGKEGAKQLAEISKKFSYNPRTWGFEVAKDKNSEQRGSALGDYDRLCIGGDYFSSIDMSGGAFGVLK